MWCCGAWWLSNCLNCHDVPKCCLQSSQRFHDKSKQLCLDPVQWSQGLQCQELVCRIQRCCGLHNTLCYGNLRAFHLLLCESTRPLLMYTSGLMHEGVKVHYGTNMVWFPSDLLLFCCWCCSCCTDHQGRYQGRLQGCADWLWRPYVVRWHEYLRHHFLPTVQASWPEGKHVSFLLLLPCHGIRCLLLWAVPVPENPSKHALIQS